VRGGRQHFVYSKVMAWVAFDRAADPLAAHASAESGRRWREIADEIHAEVCERGFDRDLDSFDNYVLQGRYEEARRLFERLVARCNDVGLLAEE
jgi:GH15 family glucan-1,4-alpha-glucosidase